MKLYIQLALALAALVPAGAAAQESGSSAPEAAPATTQEWPEAWFEIFRLAPGKHEEFVRRLALADEVARAGGQPPTQVFFHQHGGAWDVIVFKPVMGPEPTPEQEAAMAAKSKELGMESGPAYFIGIRELIASHEDSKAYGPITADQWLERLEKWRRENTPRQDR